MLDRVDRTPGELEQAFGGETVVDDLDIDEMSIIFRPCDGSYQDWLDKRRATDPEVEIVYQVGVWSEEQERLERMLEGLDLD